MLDSSNENAPLAGEAHPEKTYPTTVPSAEKIGKHAEAHRLLAKGFHLVHLHHMSKQPFGDDWNAPARRVKAIDPNATGYGMPLAANGRCSLDPDSLEPARDGLSRCGFDLEELMAAGVRTTSTRPGSGGRSTFRSEKGLRWISFKSKKAGTILDLRAASSNLQDCLPGTIYFTKDGGGPFEQQYANGKTLDDAPPLPKRFLEWWQRLSNDFDFECEQKRLFGGQDAQLSISDGKGKLAFKSPYRMRFNESHAVVDILVRHGYTEGGRDRWAPPTASGAPSVREIPGKDGLWQSDHASDPLHGTFDAWTAHVVLDHDGDLEAAEEAFVRNDIAEDFDDLTQDDSGGQLHPVPLDWATLPENPQDVPFVIPGWMPDGVVTLFAAHGDTGKSFLSLLIAVCLATGRHPFTGDAITRCKVVLYSAEDDARVMQLRLRRYMGLLGITPADLVGWLLVFDATGADNVLFAGDERVNGRTTKRFDWLKDQCAAFGANVLIFDNASDGLDANENDRAKVRQFVGCLKRLAPAVLLLSHVDAASSMADPGEAKGYSGSTGWHNSARSRWFMARVKDSDDIVLRLPKVNYARAGSEVVIRWSELSGVFEVVSARQGKAVPSDHRSTLLKLFKQVLATGVNVSGARNATNSVWNLIHRLPDCPAGLQSADVGREVGQWLMLGLAELEEYKQRNGCIGKRIILTPAGEAVANGVSEGSSADDFL